MIHQEYYDYVKRSVDEMQTHFREENSIMMMGLKDVLRQNIQSKNALNRAKDKNANNQLQIEEIKCEPDSRESKVRNERIELT